MDISQNKINLTILFSMIFTLGVISFFSQLHIILAVIISISLIILIYKNKIKLSVAVIMFLAFISGFYVSDFRVKEGDTLFYMAPRNNVVLTGRVTNIPETNKPDRTRFYLDAQSIDTGKQKFDNLDSKVIVTVNEPREVYSQIQAGDILSLKGNLRVPQKAANPHEFDYSIYLNQTNTFTAFFVDENNFSVVKKPDELYWKFLQKVDNQRNKIIEKHAKILKSPYLELLGGVVFGYGAINPTDDLKDSFKIAGLLHLLAASGLNVGLIFSIWFFIGHTFRMNYRFNIIIGGVLILIYTCMTGFSPSILRAAIMLEFILLGKLIDRQADNFALISFVCFLMLLYNPAWICSVSFQLSFLVTAGLILFMPSITEWSKRFNKFWQLIINSASVPFIAQLCVLPLQMFYFNTFATYSVLANIIVLPFITVVSFTGFISSIFAMFSFIPDVIIKLFDWILSPFLIVTVKISDFISTLPNANLITIQPDILQVLVYYALILFIALFVKEEVKNKKLLILIVLISLFLGLSFIKIPDKKLHLTFFSVKNADSCLVKTPKNHYFVIDTGKKSFTGSYSQGEGIIAKYLLAKGIKKIDFVILSHLDNDHIGGTVGLLEKIKTNKVFVNGSTPNTQTARELFEFLKKKKIPYEIVKNDDILYEEENLKLKGFLNKSVDENENSIINLLEYKDFKALFMGDAGADGYDVIPAVKDINILKLGHHGAKGVIDERTLNKIMPKTVIISTGLNQYGHPHYSIIDLLLNTDTHYLRTDDKNAIEIITDGVLKEENCYMPDLKKFIPCEN